jgi:hypothetical protein
VGVEATIAILSVLDESRPSGNSRAASLRRLGFAPNIPTGLKEQLGFRETPKT